MLSQEKNERLTAVGPGTPMGNLLRRYWWPVGPSASARWRPSLDEAPLGNRRAHSCTLPSASRQLLIPSPTDERFAAGIRERMAAMGG
jgi:hypothetical protein